MISREKMGKVKLREGYKWFIDNLGFGVKRESDNQDIVSYLWFKIINAKNEIDYSFFKTTKEFLERENYFENSVFENEK